MAPEQDKETALSGGGSGEGGEPALFAELVQLTYATIAEPEKFHDLIEIWERCLTARIVADEIAEGDSELAAHLNSALQIFDRIGRMQRDQDRAQKLLDSFSVPALICSGARQVLHENARLGQWLGSDDPLELLAESELGEQIANWPEGQSMAFVHVARGGDGDGTAVITELPEALRDAGEHGRRFLVVLNEISEDDGVWQAIRDKYALTPAETGVLIMLAQGQKADEIARARDVSINTIRAHIRALLEKTASQTQNDLVRSCIFLQSQFQSLSLVSQAFYREREAPAETEARLILPSGRMLAYREFGAKGGLPVLYLHGMMGGPDLPEQVKAEARRRGVRLLAPSRPGFGKSDTIPATDAELVQQSCRDLLAFLDTLSIPRVFVIGHLSAVGISVSFADRYPERCIGILNAGYSGIVTDALIEGMTTMSRAFARTYQRSRTAIRFLTRAAIASVDFLGAERMMRRHLGSSPVDMEYCQRTGCFDVMADGLRHAIVQGGDAFIKDGYLAVSDWSDAIARLEGRVPVFALLGEKDRIAPPHLIRARLAEIENYDVRVFPDAGQLVLFQEWSTALDLICGAFAARIEAAPRGR
ncbi:alpha/beta fold hydrolase [Rhodalgimonas zhirmunskyi]|uniref:Alpha/beta fold hydrolase n=1 Tax=Rhodalgimonas zhirmunskyi TaxID=2964767 RepID=A0AAJ1X5L6_9RHOB|nr:alpha/beta fold hydrolase [Rhodoalgimonas zhirmunskyi]MDQ2094641.1 alpha/beta fold hydrolase [Rhodoalgimonas zhirmunskyi]